VTRKTSPVWSDISASVHAGTGGKSSVNDGAILQNKERGKCGMCEGSLDYIELMK